ncbi:MAG: hypothetical protein OJF50_000789 [Nitrospira sp.]|jgi:hypothetical protein|nr:hypothetical protein [Nitrospira sp.]
MEEDGIRKKTGQRPHEIVKNVHTEGVTERPNVPVLKNPEARTLALREKPRNPATPKLTMHPVITMTTAIPSAVSRSWLDKHIGTPYGG